MEAITFSWDAEVVSQGAASKEEAMDAAAHTPEHRLILEVFRQAADDLKKVLGGKGSVEDRINAASAAHFALRGVASKYARLIGAECILPPLKALARQVLAELGRRPLAEFDDTKFRLVHEASRPERVVSRLGGWD